MSAGADVEAGGGPLSSWFIKAADKVGKGRKRWFVLDAEEKVITYFEDDSMKKKKGIIELDEASKIEATDINILITTPARLWTISALEVGVTIKWILKFHEIEPECPITVDQLNEEDRHIFAAAMDAKVLATVGADVTLPFRHRIVALQRGENATFGVQFRPHEGRAEGIEICGVAEGGTAHGHLYVGEKVVAIGNERLDGMTYPEAVHLVADVVGSAWSVLKMQVIERQRFCIAAAAYSADNERELSINKGDRILCSGDAKDGWQKGHLELSPDLTG
eukprot:gene4716-3961_t